MGKIEHGVMLVHLASFWSVFIHYQAPVGIGRMIYPGIWMVKCAVGVWAGYDGDSYN